MFQSSVMVISKKFKGFVNKVSKVFQRWFSFKSISWELKVFLKYFDNISRLFQVTFNIASRIFPGCFKCVSSLFEKFSLVFVGYFRDG